LANYFTATMKPLFTIFATKHGFSRHLLSQNRFICLQ